MIEAGIVANGFGEYGRANGGNKELDLSFELLMFGPVEATQGVGPGGRKEGIGSEGSTGKVFHQFCHGEGKMIVCFEARNGKS